MKLIATRDTSGALKLHQVTRKLDTLIDEDGNKLYISTGCLWSDPDYWKDLPGITADMGAVEVEVILRKKNFLQKKPKITSKQVPLLQVQWTRKYVAVSTSYRQVQTVK